MLCTCWKVVVKREWLTNKLELQKNVEDFFKEKLFFIFKKIQIGERGYRPHQTTIIMLMDLSFQTNFHINVKSSSHLSTTTMMMMMSINCKLKSRASSTTTYTITISHHALKCKIYLKWLKQKVFFTSPKMGKKLS